MNRPKCVSTFFLMLVGAVLGVFSGEGCSENRRLSPKETIREQLFSISATGSTTLIDAEKQLSFSFPIMMRPPTTTDPLWWFVYDHQGLLVELGTNTENPVFTLENAERSAFYYTGYFQVLTPEEDQARDKYSTYCVPTRNPVPLNKYSTYLREYNMKNPISIKELEIALELGEPVNVGEQIFSDPMWRFYYRVSHCIIRLYGTTLHDNIVGAESAKEHREEILFTGYWTVGCSTFLDRVKERFHIQ